MIKFKSDLFLTKKEKLTSLAAEMAGTRMKLADLGLRASDLGLPGTASELAEAYDKVHEAHRGLVSLLEITKDA